jgi:hypothetical protein
MIRAAWVDVPGFTIIVGICGALLAAPIVAAKIARRMEHAKAARTARAMPRENSLEKAPRTSYLDSLFIAETVH